MAEKPSGGIEVDDLAKISQALGATLDVEDPILDEYTLEVSSPGIDRPLTRAKDFAEYKGHRAKIEMALPVQTPQGGRRNFKGDLNGLEGDAISLALDDGPPVLLPLRDVSDAKLVITDALIAESLKKQRVPDASAADDIEYEEDAPSSKAED
jgi:ribosome maturation factor RimP